MSNHGQRGQPYSTSKKSDHSLYLTEQEHNKLFELFSDRSYSLCTTIAQVLEGRQGRWQLKDDGILCFVKDHQKKSFFLRLFNLNTMSVSWEMELYLEMAMNIPKDFFMTFDGDVCRIGVNFLKAEECSRMHQIINEKVCRRSSSQRARDYNNRQQNGNNMQNGYNPYQATINKHQNQTLDKELKALGNVKQIPGNQMSKDHESQLNKQRKKRKKKDKRLDKSQISVPVADGYRKHAENPQKDPQNDPQTYLQNPAVRDLIIRAGVNEHEFLTSTEKQNHIYGFINNMGMEKIQMQYQRRTASIKPDGRDRSQSAANNYSSTTLQHPPPVPVNDYSSKTLPPQRAPPPIPSNPPTKHRPKKAPPPPPPNGGNRSNMTSSGTLRKPTHALPPPPPVPGVKPQIPNNNNSAPAPPPPPPPPAIGGPPKINSNNNFRPQNNSQNNNQFPPPPPVMKTHQSMPPPPPSKINKPKIDDNRGALLSSIQNFKSTNLRKAESAPAPRPISQTSDDGDMADQLKKHLEKIRIIREDSSSGDDTDTDSEWDD